MIDKVDLTEGKATNAPQHDNEKLPETIKE